MKDKNSLDSTSGITQTNGGETNPNNPLHLRAYGNGDPFLVNAGDESNLPQIIVVTSYPPRECGIATYTQDLIRSLNEKFNSTWALKICALESGSADLIYPDEVQYVIDTSSAQSFEKAVISINQNPQVKMVLVQHEFGFFKENETAFLDFLIKLKIPAVITFHTVLPNPDTTLKEKVVKVCNACAAVVVMTKHSAFLLTSQYSISEKKTSVIPHGTHLVSLVNKEFLKHSYGLNGRKVLSTFGLLSSGKSIETTLDALPAVIEQCPEVVFLVIGITHPEVIKSEGEQYRIMLEEKVEYLNLQKHVVFINNYLTTSALLEYLQLTDIYLFTSRDPNQAVSGTFVYAMSCACPIISTPIPHAKEVLSADTGVIVDFCNPVQLAKNAIWLLKNDVLRETMSMNALQKMASSAWENSAIAYAKLFASVDKNLITLKFNLPQKSLKHLEYITDRFGIIQFSKISQPDLAYGYTLDDNARALVAMCMHYKVSGQKRDLNPIWKYLKFIHFCQQSDGSFLNYVDRNYMFTDQNKKVNLDDSNGRTVWAIGYLLSLKSIMPPDITNKAMVVLEAALESLGHICSTRAMAFAIKGLYSSLSVGNSQKKLEILTVFANRLVQMYRHETDGNWRWFEGYLTYANSILPEAMMYAWLLTHNPVYKEIAVDSMNFLLSQTFSEKGIEVISNKTWMMKQPFHVTNPSSLIPEIDQKGGQQPIDVAYTIMTLEVFFEEFRDDLYRRKLVAAFNWFLGANHLNQIIYNPTTGGCYDGLEEFQVNINQGAESMVSYLMARITVGNIERNTQPKISRNSNFCTMPIRSKSFVPAFTPFNIS